MARNKLNVAIFVILVSPFVLKAQCNKDTEEETNYIVFPKLFFSSNADQVKRFLSSNDLIGKSHIEFENHVPEKLMTSSQEQSSPTTSDDSTTSSDVQESTRAISSPGVSTEPVTDDVQWHHWNNSCYTFVNTTKMTWNEAGNKCSSMREGAHLVFIESELENKEVARLAKLASKQLTERWWIGLTDTDTEGVWKWYNVSVNYTNWGTNQPDNPGSENCVELYGLTSDSAVWNDRQCNVHHYFICEKNVTENTKLAQLYGM